MSDVFTAWNAVMADVRSLAKGERNQHQRFNFRGIDSVLNAVGPALRKHGVSVVPIETSISHEKYDTSRGTSMVGAHALVRFRVYGPDGSHFDGQVAGEAYDAGDKSTPKAMSVAMRTFLLQALCLPTEEEDPDASSHERAAAPDPRKPIADAKTWCGRVGVRSPADMKALIDWLGVEGVTPESVPRDADHARRLCEAINEAARRIAPDKMLAEAKAQLETEAAVDEAFPADPEYVSSGPPDYPG